MANLKRAPRKVTRRVADREPIGRARRVRVTMPVMLELAPGSRATAIVDDLSKDGFRLRTRVVLHPQQVLKIQMPRETIACELRWVDGCEAGGVFMNAAEVFLGD